MRTEREAKVELEVKALKRKVLRVLGRRGTRMRNGNNITEAKALARYSSRIEDLGAAP